MDSRDPRPVDVNENFDLAAETLLKQLGAESNAAASFSRINQERLLRHTLAKDHFLSAILEHPDWLASIRQAKVPQLQDQHENVTRQVGSTVRPGDIINLSYYKLHHKVVVESCQYNPDTNELSLQAIHYGREGLTYPITVMREDFKLPCDGSSMWLHKFPNSVCYQPGETLARARSRLGEQQQNPYSNNASSLALWCRVRDHHQNKDNLKVPLFADNGQDLHELKPGDHVLVSLPTSQLHAVLTSVEGLDNNGDAKLLSAVAMVEELRTLSANKKGMRAFLTGVLPLKTDRRPQVIDVNFPVEVVRQNANKFAGVSLCWECTELQAIAFLASGSTLVQQVSDGRFTIDVSEIRAGHAIWQDDRFHFVLAVTRPEKLSQTYSIETVQYAPLQLADAPKTTELRMVVSLKHRKQVHLLRHNEPDMNCAILRAWKFNDLPPVNGIELSNKQVSCLQPGEPVSIRWDTTEFPLAQHFPGLHAIVKSVEATSSDSSIVEVICYTGDSAPTVGVRKFSSNGYKLSRLQYSISPTQLASREEALQRALSRLDTGQYCCSWSNSWDLVRWCCVNHKANAPSYLRPVRRADELASLPSEGYKLRLMHLSGNNGAQNFQVASVTHSERVTDCGELLKVRLSEVGWKPSLVHKVYIEDIKYVLSRVRYNEPVEEVMSQRRQETIVSLLNASLINASDGKLGLGVTSSEFCIWLHKGHGLRDLPGLMSVAPAPPASLDCEPVTDLKAIQPWDHIVYESHLGTQHLLVVQVEPNVGSLCAYTYGPIAEPTTELTAFIYFPANKSPYMMQKIVSRAANNQFDASSQLSLALSAVTSYPYNAAAWIQMVLLELECDLLLPSCLLTSLLKSMLKFAFCVAARESNNDGKLEACKLMMESSGLATKLTTISCYDDGTKKRLLFIVRVIASLMGAGAADP